ncbi:MAG: hypothetical protein FI688_00260 [SAR202 cluster bacterium]|nr:hypothetical protein [Chloroflexota bacterium]MQG21891.1 hypothetical protein [SAR202 cluster bacterium]
MIFKTKKKIYKSITTSTDLEKFVNEAMTHPWVGIDIEGNGFFRYPERVCLIQISLGDMPYIIDPLAIDNMDPLGFLLNDMDVVKILHSGDYDIRSLNRDYGFTFKNIFDTSISAAFLGSPKLGLDAILKEYMNVIVSKDKNLQRSDWTNRPLSNEAIKYAADDVRYLGQARKVMTQQLEKRNRYSWVQEEFDRLSKIKFEIKDENQAFLNLKGSNILTEKELPLLKRLYDLREDEAIGKDRPPFKIVSDSVLVSIAKDPKTDYVNIKGIGWWKRPDMKKRIKELVQKSKEDPPIRRPDKIRKTIYLSNKEREKANARFRELKLWRKNIGDGLGLDPSLLWPTLSLKRLSKSPNSIQTEFQDEIVRKWQVKEFGNDLTEQLNKSV